MDSTAPTAPRDSEIINEMLSRVMDGFDCHNTPGDSEIMNEHVSRVIVGLDSPNSPQGFINRQRNAVTGEG